MSRQIPPELEKALRQALRTGNKEEAKRIFREATGAGERFARFAVFLMSFSKVSEWSPDPPSNESDGSASDSANDARTRPPEPEPRATPGPPAAATPSAGGRRSAVKASSGCGSVFLLALGPLLFAAGWILVV